jgi:hypothetical protein
MLHKGWKDNALPFAILLTSCGGSSQCVVDASSIKHQRTDDDDVSVGSAGGCPLFIIPIFLTTSQGC